MKFKYDTPADAGYVTVGYGPVAATKTVWHGNYVLNVDVDQYGNLLGVEIV